MTNQTDRTTHSSVGIKSEEGIRWWTDYDEMLREWVELPTLEGLTIVTRVVTVLDVEYAPDFDPVPPNWRMEEK